MKTHHILWLVIVGLAIWALYVHFVKRVPFRG